MARRLTAVLPVVGNLVRAAVSVGAGVVPVAEHGLNGLNELRLRVGVQFHVLGDALGFLHLVDDFSNSLLFSLNGKVLKQTLGMPVASMLGVFVVPVYIDGDVCRWLKFLL